VLAIAHVDRVAFRIDVEREAESGTQIWSTDIVDDLSSTDSDGHYAELVFDALIQS
jgi:hypothetical protein